MTIKQSVRSTTFFGLGALCLLALSALPSHAQITKTGGAAGLFQLTGNTQNNNVSNVTQGKNESATDFFWFAEKQNVSISGLAVNDIGGGRAGNVTGTVDSYMLYTDQIGNSLLRSTTYDITVHFTQQILGVITGSARLSLTDPLFARSGTIYPSGLATLSRGQEFPDTLAFSATNNTLTIHNVTSDNVNEIRVLTAVPEASTMLGFGALLGAGGFGLLRSRRVRKTA